MKNLQEATERICELKGGLVALDVLVPAVIDALSAPARARLMASFDAHAEAARTVMLHADISDVVLATFERDVARNRALLARGQSPARPGTPAGAADPLLLATTPVTRFSGDRVTSRASGFFFRRGDRLFLVSGRHGRADAGSASRPDRVEFVHRTDPHDPTRHLAVSLPLQQEGRPLWREATDAGGAIDVAVLEIPAERLPAGVALPAFDETHLDARDESVALGDALVIAGFPTGLHDVAHLLPVARSAIVASAHGVRFQGRACFLTDARMPAGSGGAPVVRRRTRDASAGSAPSWQLLGVHATRTGLPMPGDPGQGEDPALHCAWYADVLDVLTADA